MKNPFLTVSSNNDIDQEIDEDAQNSKINTIFTDCLKRFRKFFLQKQLKEITITIKEIEKSGNNKLIDSLKRKKIELAKRITGGLYFEEEFYTQ